MRGVSGELLKVPAKDLRPGDFCLGSKQTVLAVENDGAHIPPGKVRMSLLRESGRERVALWNRSTQIGIRRLPPPFAPRPLPHEVPTFERPDGSAL